MDQCCRNFMAATQCSVPEAVAAASARPARLLFGADTLRGTLQPGAPAELVLLTEALRVEAVYRHGEVAWRRSSGGGRWQ